MIAKVLFEDLTSRDVHLSVETGNLKIIAPRGLLTDADRAAIRQHKAELLELLASKSASNWTPAAAETARRLTAGVTPCCCSRFTEGIIPARCTSCDLAWPTEDLEALRVYLEQKRNALPIPPQAVSATSQAAAAAATAGKLFE